jgi:hypothetical protein
MAIIKSYSPFLNLSNYSTFLVDSNSTSEYFRISDLKETLTGGKNGFLIEGSEYLKETTEIKIEILDVNGNPIYFEPGNGIPEYYEGLSKLIAVHVYEDTPIGIGKITILGELKTYVSPNGLVLPIPSEWQGTYNVKWERTFQINKNLNNETIVRFYKRPTITIDELVKPIFSKTIPTITQSGSVSGISEIPTAGSNINNWSAGTLYKLKIEDNSNWTSSVDENIISIPSLGYSATVKEVLNNKEILVNIPYTTGSIVSDFPPTPYTTSFEYVEGQIVGESALTGSFAKINIQQLKTFVGDVARVKVYRKSRNDVGDYQFVQESKLEASELLRDITSTLDTDISYGNFTDSNLSTYWITSSNDHPTSLNVDILNASVKVDYNSGIGGVQQLITSESFNVSKDVEYTLSFKTLLSGSIDGQKTLKAYFSSSDYQQTFLTVSGSDIYKTRQTISQNILATNTSNAKLVLEFSGDDWYVSNVSLQNAQETSFSPDEFTIVQEIPRNIPVETFDFRFEFYDINNNYIPVVVNSTKTFTGGNNFLASTKFLSFATDRTAFRFSTGSFANPPYQSLHLSTQRNGLTGSVFFYSSAYDMLGNWIDPVNYSASGTLEYGVNWPNQIQYPGGITNQGDGGGLLHIHDFSGSLDYSGSVNTIRVGSIVYTASCEGLHEYETIYRFEDGDNAPSLFVNSNTNQFIYKATDLSLNPTGQNIVVQAKRKNLASTTTPITINSGSGKPALTHLSDDPTTGVSTYQLSGTSYPYIAGETTYEFTGSDQFGNNFSDIVKITPVKILDGLSVSLSNENATLPALSTGFVSSGSFSLTSGSVSVKIGGETITHSNGLIVSNSFDIISAIPSNVLTGSLDYSTADYYITRLDSDTGSLELNIRYKDGYGDTTDVSKIVSFSKAKKTPPIISVFGNPQSQTITSGSLSGIGTPLPINVSVKEGSSNYTYGNGTNKFTISNVSAYFSQSAQTANIIYTGSLSQSASGSALISYINSEGTPDSQTINFSIGVAAQGVDGSNGAPGIVVSTPPSQIVTRSNTGTYGIPTAISASVVEGNTIYSYDNSSPYTSGSFYISNVVNGTNNNNKSVTPTTPTTTAGITTTFNVNYTTLGGVPVTIPQTHSVLVTLDGQTGPGVVHTGPWVEGRSYQFSTGAGTGRRDVVLYPASGTGTYYATTQQHTSTAAGVTGPPTVGSYWESLGSEDFFVAAKIGLFEDSYVQSTLNIGTNNSGGVSSANITLSGGTAYPYFSLGQTVAGVYNANGIYIGSDSGVYKMSLKSATNSLTWDGSTLGIVGTITIKNPATANDGGKVGSFSNGDSHNSGDVGGWTLSANAIYRGTIGSDNTYTTNAGDITLGAGWISAKEFKISSAGAASFKGALSAPSGNIGGFSIGGSQFYTGTKSSYASNAAGVYLGNDGIALGTNSPFKVDSSGNLTATSVDITGAVTATSGTFTGTIYANAGVFAGNLSAASGSFGGSLTVNTGYIGGWAIGPNTLSSNNNAIVLDSTSKTITLNDSGNAPRVLINQNNTFGSLSGTYTNSGTYTGPTDGTSYYHSATITTTIDNAALVSTNGKTYSFSLTDNSSGTAFYIPNIGGYTIYQATYGYWYTLESTTTPSLKYYVGQSSATFYGPQSGAVSGYYGSNGYNQTITITGNGDTFKLVQNVSITIFSTYQSGVYINSSNRPDASWSTAEVNSFVEIIAGGIQVGRDSSKYVKMDRNAGTGTMLEVGGAITATGNITAFYTSDKRLKENIIPIENALDKIDKINGVEFDWTDKFIDVESGGKGEDGFFFRKHDIGIIAQEINEVLPEAVGTRDDGYMAVRYEKVVPLLIQAIKELKTEIKELKENR